LNCAELEFTQIFPAGWVEHDPHEISFSQIGVAAEAVGCADIRAGDIAAIGITNQRETTVVWDRKTGEPVHNAIVWQDRRTAPLCDKLRADGLTQTVQEKTGLVIDPIFRAPRWPGS
jgi:glycerol kinase